MSQKVYVGNLPYRTTVDDLNKLFEKYNPIRLPILISDKNTARSLGYAFIELEEPMASVALCELRGTVFNGRNLIISMATGRTPKNNAPKRDFLKKSAFAEKIPEKFGKFKCATTTPVAPPPYNRQVTTECVMVAETSNYG